MKRFIFMVGLIASVAFAGERWLGTLSTAGLTQSNKGITGDAGFVIQPMSKITVQCINPDAGSASAWVCVDTFTCTAGRGLYLTGTQALPTSVGGTLPLADGGVSAGVSALSAEVNNCFVYERNGKE